MMKSRYLGSRTSSFLSLHGTAFQRLSQGTKDLIMIGDRIVAVLATQGQSCSILQLFYLDIESEKFVEVSTTILPEIVDSMNWLPR